MTIGNSDVSDPAIDDSTRRPRDWKSYFGLIIGILGLVMPVVLWQFDLASTSISTRVVSSFPLVLNHTAQLKDIEVLVGGTKIDSPFVSTLEITNDGAKPIPSANFEAPLEFVLGATAKLVRATISSSEPAVLDAKLLLGERSIKLQPLLLNPGDTMRVLIITSGGEPNFSVRGRINSIRRIELNSENNFGWGYKIRYLFLAIFCAVLYPIALVGGYYRDMRPTRLTMACLALAVAYLFVIVVNRAAIAFDLADKGLSMLVVALGALIAFPVLAYLTWRRRE